MTKRREEIREEIAIRLALYKHGVREEDLDPHWLRAAQREADELLTELASMGVVIKVGEIWGLGADASPKTYFADAIGVSMEHSASTFRMFKDAGYVAVEPLGENDGLART